MRTVVAWLPVAALVAWTAMRQLGLERGFPLTALVAFTPVVALGGLACVALAALLRRGARGDEDPAAEVGSGLSGTWPQGRRWPPPVTIDHVLVDERAGVRAVSVHTISRTDHRAVLAELVLPQTSSVGGRSSSARTP